MDAQAEEPTAGTAGTTSGAGVDVQEEPFSASMLPRYRAVIRSRSQRLLAGRSACSPIASASIMRS